jgi:hypothetical protein
LARVTMFVIEQLVIFLCDIAHLSTYPHTFLNFYHFDIIVVMQIFVFGIKHAKSIFRQVVVLETQQRRGIRVFRGGDWFVG